MKISIAIPSLLLLSGVFVSSQLAAQARAGTADVNGISLRYEIEGSGKPLVLIHGWALSLLPTTARHHYRLSALPPFRL